MLPRNSPLETFPAVSKSSLAPFFGEQDRGSGIIFLGADLFRSNPVVAGPDHVCDTDDFASDDGGTKRGGRRRRYGRNSSADYFVHDVRTSPHEMMGGER